MTKHHPTLVRSPQWWKHLREWKRVFWKKDRKAAQAEDDAEMEAWAAASSRALKQYLEEDEK